jgi:hypothetical protein
MKNIRNFVVLFSIIAAAVAANAQISFHGKFQLTSETRWGKAVLPAGHYSLTMDSAQSPIVIRSEDGKVSAMAEADFGELSAPGDSYIFVTGYGKDRQIRSINLPQLGLELMFKPLTRRERETLYGDVSQAIPVQMAKK